MRSAPTLPTGDVRLRLVALPTEHGGWGLLLEPIALGLLVAPSRAGLLLGLAAAGVFLTRHPLMVALTDRRRGTRYPRTVWAERFAMLYALGALAAFAAVLLLDAPFWRALALAAPLAIVQLAYDLRKRSRLLLPELAGACALVAAAPAIALAGGWTLLSAFGLWAVLAARAVAAIIYIRTRIRQLRGLDARAWPTLLVHGAGLLAIAALAASEVVPWLAVLAMALLLGRAAHGLAPGRPAVRPAMLGGQELAFGILTVLLVALGNGRHM